ncbi:MAG: sulfur carrier protein ThiS [Bacteroides sp.]|nr:sulfur carrier protein ThiS [Bacteroides sp.]
MILHINGQTTDVPSDIYTLEDFAEWRGIPEKGTAIAVNARLVKRENWPAVTLKDLDSLTVISAAFGG